MNTTAIRAVIDTNILIAIIGRHSPHRWIFDKIISGEIILCVTNEIILEYREVLAQKNGLAVADAIFNFLTIHAFVAHFEPSFDFKLITADPEDDKFVNCAVVSGSFLVSNDRHFQILKIVPFPKVAYLTLDEFTAIFKEF